MKINLSYFERFLNYPLSMDEVRQILHTNVILYKDIYHYKDLDDILINDSAIVLYQDTEHSGHYCAIKKLENEYYFFDPYGMTIDEQKKYMKKDYNIQLIQQRNILKLLFFNKTTQGYKVHFSQYHLQRKSPDIATCGYWCIAFIKSEMNEDDFHNKINYISNKYNFSKDFISILMAFSIF